MKYLITIAILLLTGCNEPLGWAKQARNQHISDLNAIKAIIGEAENQGEYGMLAVACAIRNRGTLQGVYGLHANRVINHKYSNKIYAQAKHAWQEANEPADIEGADNCGMLAGAQYWEGASFKKPYWAYKMTQTAVINKQVFYRE